MGGCVWDVGAMQAECSQLLGVIGEKFVIILCVGWWLFGCFDINNMYVWFNYFVCWLMNV